MDLTYKKGVLVLMEFCCEFMKRAMVGETERLYRVEKLSIVNMMYNYPEIKYCPWCGKKIKIVIKEKDV